jgi:hypothetical protein
MTTTGAAVVLWAPRIAGIAVSLFLALFALDAFNGKSFFEALPEFVIHLAPAFLVLAVVALAWRAPLIGAAACLMGAVGYGMMVHWRLDWMAVIAGPLVVVGVLFLLSWQYGPARITPAGAR